MEAVGAALPDIKSVVIPALVREFTRGPLMVHGRDTYTGTTETFCSGVEMWLHGKAQGPVFDP